VKFAESGFVELSASPRAVGGARRDLEDETSHRGRDSFQLRRAALPKIEISSG
jgi:hypothetical protein